MEFHEWKRTVWPTLSAPRQDEIRLEVSRLRNFGWTLDEAWIQAACTA